MPIWTGMITAAQAGETNTAKILAAGTTITVAVVEETTVAVAAAAGITEVVTVAVITGTITEILKRDINRSITDFLKPCCY